MNDAAAIRPNLFIIGTPNCGTTALALTPEARFIVMLRDPLQIANVFHMEQVFSRNEDVEDFEAARQLQDACAEGRSIPPQCREPAFLQNREVAAIGPQLTRFFETPPPERRVAPPQEDLQNDPRAVWRRTPDFLDLPDDGRQSFAPVNAARAHRFKWLADFALNPPGPLKRPIYALRQWLNRHRPPAIERLKSALRRAHQRPPLRPEFNDQLRAAFAQDVATVQRLLDRDLSHWLRD